MRRGTALVLALATLLVVGASACGGSDSGGEISSGSSSGTTPPNGGGNDGGAADGTDTSSADGGSSGSSGGDGSSMGDGASPEAGGDASSTGPKWKCSDKTRQYQNAGACQNAHDLLCQPPKAGVDEGLPCPSNGDIYITCGACNGQSDFNSRDCLCLAL